MNVPPHGIASHLTPSEDTKILHFVCNFRVDLDGKWHVVETNMWLRDDVRSIAHLPYASNEGFEILQKQWISLIIVQHPIFTTTLLRGYQRILCTIWRVDVGWNRHGDTHMWFIDAASSFFHHACVSEEGFKTIHRQLLSYRVIQHIICRKYW